MSLQPPRKLETAKSGVGLDRCEDASWAVYPHGSGLATLAVSDGASESAFSGEWARILTRRFVSGASDICALDASGMLAWLDTCGREWDRGIPWDRIPWHGQAKTRTGAFATFLGVAVSRDKDKSGAYPWQAVAVGDSCLFVVRNDALDLSFPLSSSSEFNNVPALVCSNPANNTRVEDHLRLLCGKCWTGDTILLASDAVAAWILRENEAGGKPWEQLIPLDSPGKWNTWVQERRAEKAMRDDDATLMMANFG